MIIDFNKGNGGGNMSNYWNSAVTEEHIESAASITYASATSYTDQALEDIDLSEYWTSAQTQSAITSVEDHLFDVEEVTASALTELHEGLLEVSARTVDLSDYYTSAQTESAITMAVSGKADKMNIDVNTSYWAFPSWNNQGIVTGVVKRMYTPKITINGKVKEYPDARGNGDVPPFWAPQSAGTTGQILKSTGDVPEWVDNNFVTSADVKTQVEAYNYATTAKVESAYTILDEHITDVEKVSASALTELHDAIELFKPVLIYSGNPGFYAINSSALTTWQVEGLDLSEFKYIRFYIKASNIGFNDSNNFTAPMYVDVILDPEAKSSQYDAYLGVTSNICAGNRNRSFTTVAAVDSTKTKVQLLYQTSLWDVTVSSAASDGRYCYKIEGYRF